MDHRPGAAFPRAMTDSGRIKLAIISLLMVLQVFYTVSLTRPAHFTLDEGVYHMMARSMARDGSLAVWNGYTETPSEELVFPLIRKDLRDPLVPRLVSQYPSVYAFIAAPFYMIGGFKGLFWINLLAFFGTAWTTAAIARRLYGDNSLALNAILILILGTFAWEYVQGSLAPLPVDVPGDRRGSGRDRRAGQGPRRNRRRHGLRSPA